MFSVDEPSPTIRGVNRPIPQGYPGHEGDAAPITTPGLRPLSTRERSLVQTFPRNWDLCGNKSDIEQIIGNAVPCALGEFVGRAMAQFDQMPHRRIKPQVDSVIVLTQHANVRADDTCVVALEPVDHELIAAGSQNEKCVKPYEPCKMTPTQMLLAVERKKARMSEKQAAAGRKGKKLVQKRKANRSKK